MVTTSVRIDLRARTATVDPACARVRTQVKADAVLALVLTARAERHHRSRPITAHDCCMPARRNRETCPMPTRVGELRWPVLSAIRVGTTDEPAEFVVIVDCGEPTPREPYATLRVFVWPEHTVAQQGEYDLTFAQAQRSMLERAGMLPSTSVEVVVMREPDRANDYTVFIDGTHHPNGTTDRVRVRTHDIDPGADGVTEAWVAAELQRTDTLSEAAAAHARDIITSYADDERLQEAEVC